VVDDRLLVGVVIKDDDLQDLPRPIRSDNQVPAFARDNTEGVLQCVSDVFIVDPVSVRALGDLHTRQGSLVAEVSSREPCLLDEGALARLPGMPEYSITPSSRDFLVTIVGGYLPGDAR
jgi:hypothetical protein